MSSHINHTLRPFLFNGIGHTPRKIFFKLHNSSYRLHLILHFQTCTHGSVLSSSSHSLKYSRGGINTFGSSVTVQISVMERCLELLKQHQGMKEGKAPAVPLLVQPPGETHAILICNFLVPRGKKEECMKSLEYTTTVAARVYPHLLVHIGLNEVKYVHPIVNPLAIQSVVQSAPPITEKPDRCCGRCAQVTIVFLTLLLMIPICVFVVRLHKR